MYTMEVRNNKILFILLSGSVILVTLVFGVYLQLKFATQVVSPITTSQATPTPYQEELTTWFDQSDFSFQYPKTLKLNPHNEDQQNYANIELTSSTHSGSLIVWAKDTNVSDIDDWGKQVKFATSIDTTLGGEPAKKIITSDAHKKLITTVVRDGYLYQIEVNPTEAEFWNKIYDIVAKSFKFTSAEIKPSVVFPNLNNQDNASSDEFEGDEEVVE